MGILFKCCDAYLTNYRQNKDKQTSKWEKIVELYNMEASVQR